MIFSFVPPTFSFISLSKSFNLLIFLPLGLSTGIGVGGGTSSTTEVCEQSSMLLHAPSSPPGLESPPPLGI